MAPDGLLTLTPTGGETMQGGVSQSGAFGVLGGSQGAGNPPCLYVFFRR